MDTSSRHHGAIIIPTNTGAQHVLVNVKPMTTRLTFCRSSVHRLADARDNGQHSTENAPRSTATGDNAPENQLSEWTTSSGGDENQMTPHKPGRSRAAVDPAKAIEKAAKVSLTLSANAVVDYILGALKEKGRREKKLPKP